MAKAADSSPLEELDLSSEEVRRLTSAFQDPEFRRMFSEYAQEITDPENRRRYEAEITALERERGMEVRFVHPEPGYVLRTSLDGAGRCYVNVCSNALLGAPTSRPGPAPGSHWSLPYSLAPGRQYAGRGGSRYTVYDVVFHPDALALAGRRARFRQMLDATALEAVEQQFRVQLDRRNAKTLKIKYKGTPEAAVLRTPLPGGGGGRPEGASEGPIPDFPYPYPHPAAAESPAGPRPPAPSPPEAAPQPAPTEPRCSVVQRHHVDLQDYRCSRDSAPSPVPRELVVTIELPLLRSAGQAVLEVSGKLLCLDSRKPDYRLRLSLPYPVDDSRGKAQFNKARRQLVVTLPVAQSATRREPRLAPEEAAWTPEEAAGTPGSDVRSTASGAPDELAWESEERAVGAPGSDVRSTASGALDELVPESVERVAGESNQKEKPAPGAGSSPGDAGGGFPCASSRGAGGASPAGSGGACGEPRGEPQGAGGDRSDPAMGGPAADGGEPVCPPLQCRQDEDSLTLLVQVPGVQPQSLQGDLSPFRYKLSFSAQDLAYSLLLQFAAENKLSTKEPEISISADNAVVVLAKSPGSRGHWREWYCGLNSGSLEERLFVSEDNVNEFLEAVLSPPCKQTVPPTPPLIEVLQVTDERIQIHAELQECSNPDQLRGKEKIINEGCPLSENENIEHLTTATVDSDSSIAVKAPEIDICGSAAGFQQEPLDVSEMILGQSQPPEAKMEPGFVKEKSAAYSNEEDSLKESVTTAEKKLDGGHQSSSLNKTAIHNTTDFDSIKETNMRDGSVQVIKDHVTHCAFSFQNSLLYDLD
ncbi:PREDICTED: protein kintoun [Chinchilla lanigera]|uniref:Protein kintoun n=1 Tax=Chinchilla lanigera TaxID=34839 RepID=A0A8C2VYT2_CHILA|nr:PREDICTED: protein kintoun [Chinchilla lanigera]